MGIREQIEKVIRDESGSYQLMAGKMRAIDLDRCEEAFIDSLLSLISEATTRSSDVAEAKLFETTNYLVTIAKRVMSDLPYGMGTELYFISEDVKNALENIGGELAETFAKEIEKAGLQKKLSGRKEIKETINNINNLIESVELYELEDSEFSGNLILDLERIKKLLEVKGG